MNWGDIQTAIHNWISQSSGLAPEKVIFANQDGPRPSNTWISIETVSIDWTGQDWTRAIANPNPTPGNEIIYKVFGTRQVNWRVQCFNAPPVGDNSAFEILNSIIVGAELPTYREMLDLANIGLLGFGSMNNVGAEFRSELFEPRATLDFKTQITTVREQTITNIESVEFDVDIGPNLNLVTIDGLQITDNEGIEITVDA